MYRRKKNAPSDSLMFPLQFLFKKRYLKLIEAEKTRFLTDLLRHWSDGVVRFGHFSGFPLRHTLL